MLIDKAFLERLTQGRLEQLAEYLASDLTALYPQRIRTLGTQKTLAFTHTCAQESYALGCKNYGELRAYSFIALQLGTGFASDPLYPSISQTLKEDGLFALKLEKITRYTMAHFYLQDKASLEAYRDALKALLRVNLAKVKNFTTYSEIVEVLVQVYPQRVEALGGKAAVYEAIKLSTHSKPQKYAIDHPIGVFVYASLVFFLGHKVDSDPLYSWVGHYLNTAEPRMAYKLDRLVKVIEKRIKSTLRATDTILKEYEV